MILKALTKVLKVQTKKGLCVNVNVIVLRSGGNALTPTEMEADM